MGVRLPDDDEVFEVAGLEELEDVGEHRAVGDGEQRFRDFLQLGRERQRD